MMTNIYAFSGGVFGSGSRTSIATTFKDVLAYNYCKHLFYWFRLPFKRTACILCEIHVNDFIHTLPEFYLSGCAIHPVLTHVSENW